jgi:beta-lactamase class A
MSQSLLKNVDLRRNTNRKLVAVVFGITGVMSAILWIKGRHQILTPLKISYTVSDKKIDTTRDTSRPTAKLLTDLRLLTSGEGSYAIYVYRLDENKGYGLNEDNVMPAASMMKVPIMAAVFKAIEENKIKLDETYKLDKSDIRTGSGPIEFMDPGTLLTIKKLMEEMGKKSDNTAPVVLTRLVGKAALVKAIADLGMTNTSFEENTTTAADLGAMWKNLQQGKYLNAEDWEEMKSFLQDSIYEDRIPVGLPQGTQLVHKVGSDLNVWADTGIVFTTPPFVLTILNKDVNLTTAKEIVPQLSKKIWEFESAHSHQEAQ